MLVLNEDEKLLREMAHRVVAEHSPVSALRALRDEGSQLCYSPSFWTTIANLGWLGILIEEAADGAGLGHVGATILCEEMGRTLAPSPFIPTAMMATTLLRHASGSPATPTLCADIASGRSIIVCALEEGRKHDPKNIATVATRLEHGWRIDGAKSFVPEGYAAQAYIVSARDAGSGELSLYLVEAGTAGLCSKFLHCIDSRNAASLAFDHVLIPDSNCLATNGSNLLARALDAGRLGLAAELSGIANECFDRTLGYLCERKQFGRYIGSFQALQHRLAHLHCQLELLRGALLKAARGLDLGAADSSLMISLSKAKAEEVARLAVSEAIQLHGGIGMTDELDLGFFMKRVRAVSECLGDAHFHLDRFASLRGY